MAAVGTALHIYSVEILPLNPKYLDGDRLLLQKAILVSVSKFSCIEPASTP